jgi:5-formyltetrahydrofolate cyclo-ligase
VSDSLPDGVSREEAEAYRAAAKEALRQRVAALRRTLVADKRAAHAAAMNALLTEQPAFRDAKVLLAYSALRFEIDPRAAVERAWAEGKTVVLPRIVQETRALTLHVYEDGDELVESGFAIREPRAEAPQLAPEQVDLVLVPGLAFDARGHRLGFGQGFYDRLLPRLTRAQRVGLCFELSLLAEVPNAPHDAPVDLVITERRSMACVR